MSKWNKQNPQPLTQQFIENEERRKQMIIQAAKRRKQKQKKLLEQEELKKKDEQQALVRHKQEKKDAYVKYLRNNMYDKYQEAKRKKKESESEIKPLGKWKKKSTEKQENDNHLQALDLQVKLQNEKPSQFSEVSKKNQSSSSNNNIRKKLNEEFEKQWQFQIDVKDELLSSKLLDSLDLDVGTLNRDYQMKQMIKEKHKKTEPKEQKEEQINELRDIIGYQSIVMTKNTKINNDDNKLKPEPVSQPIKAFAKKPQVDEVQLLNELKHKKQAKMLQWAIQQQQQAEDLFSQCSSVNRKKQPKALKQLNQQLKNKKVVNNNKKALDTIKEVARQKLASRERKTSSNQTPKEVLKQPPTQVKIQKPRQTSKDKIVKNDPQDSKSLQKKANATFASNPTFHKKQQSKKEPAKTANGFSSDKNMTRIKSASQQKRQAPPLQQQKIPIKPTPIQAKQEINKNPAKPEQPKKLFGKIPPLPALAKADNNSIATYDQQIDVESFIKQDLMNLNEQQRQIQEQLRLIHKDHRQKIKQVYSKYQIKNDYGHSNEITGNAPRQKQLKYYQNEADIEESIQNLDNYLIRKDLQSKQQDRITKQQSQQQYHSYINPFSKSEELCNQVLQLAKNISRFEKKPPIEDPNGYNYMNRMKRNNSGNKISEVSRITKDSKKEKQKQKQQQFLSESQQVSQVRDRLQRPPFIFDASQISLKGRNDEQKVQKIHVNAKLLKGLLLDDD